MMENINIENGIHSDIQCALSTVCIVQRNTIIIKHNNRPRLKHMTVFLCTVSDGDNFIDGWPLIITYSGTVVDEAKWMGVHLVTRLFIEHNIWLLFAVITSVKALSLIHPLSASHPFLLSASHHPLVNLSTHPQSSSLESSLTLEPIDFEMPFVNLHNYILLLLLLLNVLWYTLCHILSRSYTNSTDSINVIYEHVYQLRVSHHPSSVFRRLAKTRRKRVRCRTSTF